MKRAGLGLIGVVLAVAVALPAYARECEHVRMPDTLTVDGVPLSLVGMGLREATIFNVNVYVAGLYLQHPTHAAAQVINSEQKKHLVLHFVHEVSRSDMVKAFREGFEHAHAPASVSSQIRAVQPLAAGEDPRRAEPLLHVHARPGADGACRQPDQGHRRGGAVLAHVPVDSGSATTRRTRASRAGCSAATAATEGSARRRGISSASPTTAAASTRST